IVRGLAWTRVGGTTLSVEVNCMPGEGKFRVTGNLGKVMTESAEAAVSYIRSQNERFKLEPDFYKKKDIHIHIPEGATPKDGPSAGVTMATAIISALTGRKVRNDVAMTGEITIRGRVLPIGGLQEKVLAAKKVGIKTVILPKENKKDLDEIMDEIKDGMQFVLAETMEDVLQTALVKGEKDA
ncbi:S16 family serine protease, partial [Anaerotignum faecicola]